METEQNRIALGEFVEKIDSSTIRSNLLTYSDTEVGTRHPDLPVGAIYRDQGQFDIYAGQTRIIGDMSGHLAFYSKALLSNARYIGFPSTSWFDINIGEKRLNPTFDSDLSVIAAKKELSMVDYFVVTKSTRVDLRTGEILNATPLTTIFSKEDLTVDYDLVDSPGMDHYELYMKKLIK